MKPLPPRDDDETPDDDEGPLDDTGVLARRLEELRDPAWVEPVFAAALAQMTPAGERVQGFDIDYCKIKPNRDINLVARVRVERPGGGTTVRRLSCMVFPSAEACRQKFAEDEGGNPLAPSTLRRLAAEGLSQPVARLDDPAMIVRAFPVDPLLPGLTAATDFAAMQPVLQRQLEACVREGYVPRAFRYETLHYKPRRSCTLHYEVELAPGSGAGEVRRERLFGKVSRDDRGVRNHAVLEAAWQASLATGRAWSAARPVAYLPEWRLLLQEAVPGRDFRHVFAELTPDEMTPELFRRAGQHLASIMRAIRSLQGAPLGPGPAKTFEVLHAEQERNLAYLAGAEPELAAELAAIRSELVTLARETRANRPVFCHGDFAHGNVLIDGERVGIIDFDKAAAAEPAYDVAYFLTHMASFGIRHPRRMPHVVALAHDMRQCYLGLAPEVSSERLALYEALDFASYVLRNFRKQSHQASWRGWAQAQVEAAWERLAAAAGRKGAVP